MTKLNPNFNGIHRRAVREIYKRGWQVTVYWGWEESATPKSAREAIAEIEAVEGGSDFGVFTKSGDRVGSVIVAIGNDYEETIADWSWNQTTEDGQALNQMLDELLAECAQ